MNDTLVMDYAKEILDAIGKRKEQITQDGGIREHALEMQIIDSYEILMREIAAGNDVKTDDTGVLANHIDPTFVSNIQNLSNLKAPKDAEEWKQLEKDAQDFSLTSLMQGCWTCRRKGLPPRA